MKTKQIKATRLSASLLYFACRDHWLLPADADSYERIVEQGATVLHTKSGWGSSYSWRWLSKHQKREYLATMRAVLSSYGITNPAKKGRK